MGEFIKRKSGEYGMDKRKSEGRNGRSLEGWNVPRFEEARAEMDAEVVAEAEAEVELEVEGRGRVGRGLGGTRGWEMGGIR